MIYPNLCGKSVVTIGGAYSVDKWYRLANNWQWFKDEQLHAVERDFIAANLKGKKVDYVFSHTCPLEYQPRELFLSSINQNLVDDNMEKWMQKKIKMNLFGTSGFSVIIMLISALNLIMYICYMIKSLEEMKKIVRRKNQEVEGRTRKDRSKNC